MLPDSYVDAFGQPATHCCDCYAGFHDWPISSATAKASDQHRIDSALGLSLDPWALAALSVGFTNDDGNHHDVNTFVTSPSHNVSPRQALGAIQDVTSNRDQNIPIWSPNLSPSNREIQQQAVRTPNNGSNNELNHDVSFAPHAWNATLQGVAQSLSHVTPGFDQPFIPTLDPVDYLSVYSGAVANGQPDLTPQLSDFDVYNDFSVMPNSFANPTSFTQWDDLTVINPQENMANVDQLPLTTTTGIPAALALPAYASSIITAPTVPLSVARRVVPRRSNGNNNAHACHFTGCGKVFARPGDLARHRNQHGLPQHPCLIDGCNRRGSKAFYRADKLRDHQRKKHKMVI
ncbi:hypothetical protein CJF32_00009233 [Rutstroemia sp. NJR-2017a WRK4]|nr:hypothetical protein CJF32_00009233 [Rutstroemia sp. NJR-2017a WRK4]